MEKSLLNNMNIKNNSRIEGEWDQLISKHKLRFEIWAILELHTELNVTQISHFIEHICPLQVDDIMEKFNLLLSKKGRLIFITPINKRTIWYHPTHTRIYPYEALKNLFDRHGFRVVHKSYISNDQPPFSYIFRKINRKEQYFNFCKRLGIYNLNLSKIYSFIKRQSILIVGEKI